MATNRLAHHLRQGRPQIGVANIYPATGILETMCRDWDFVWIDGQHGQIDYQAALHAVQTAAGVGVETVLRVPGDEASVLGPWADLDPSAIMVPLVNTQAQAQAIVDRLRFAPLGQRSYGGRRAADRHGFAYYRDSELLVIAQIETPEAVRQARAIVQTPGIDMLFFGAADMMVRMGLSLDTPLNESPELQAAMAATAKAARDAGKWAGCVATTPEVIRVAMEMGYQLLSTGSDVGFLRRGASEQLARVREVLTQT